MPLPAIDHVVISVAGALDPANAAFQRLGFTMTPRGHHSHGSSNNLAMFGTDYLELLGHEAGNAGSRPELWVGAPKLSGLVFQPLGPRGFEEPMIAAGAPLEPGREFHRPVELPGGPQDAKFRTVTFARDRTPYGRVYFCHQFTPDVVWRPEWQSHANGAVAVAEFVFSAPDPAATAAVFGEVFGATALAATEGGVAMATAGGNQVLFLTPAAAAGRYGDALPPGDPAEPRMVALVLRTASLAAAGAALQAGGIAAQASPGRLLVPASSAYGTALGFVG